MISTSVMLIEVLTLLPLCLNTAGDWRVDVNDVAVRTDVRIAPSDIKNLKFTTPAMDADTEVIFWFVVSDGMYFSVGKNIYSESQG